MFTTLKESRECHICKSGQATAKMHDEHCLLNPMVLVPEPSIRSSRTGLRITWHVHTRKRSANLLSVGISYIPFSYFLLQDYYLG